MNYFLLNEVCHAGPVAQAYVHTVNWDSGFVETQFILPLKVNHTTMHCTCK